MYGGGGGGGNVVRVGSQYGPPSPEFGIKFTTPEVVSGYGGWEFIPL